jgi:DNA-binding MarR family transcriptional regulator
METPVVEKPNEAAFRALIRTCGLLARVMQPYFARFGISGSQWGILRVLHRAETDGESGLRLTDLGERVLIRPPSVTGAVDRLQRQGLVVRDPSAKDQRVKQVRLTSGGRRLVGRVLKGHAEQVSTALAALSLSEQKELLRLLERLGSHLNDMIDIQAGAPVE